MGKYYMTPQMLGDKPFNCFTCGKTLITSFTASVFKIQLDCPRCKCQITVLAREPIPLVVDYLKGKAKGSIVDTNA